MSKSLAEKAYDEGLSHQYRKITGDPLDRKKPVPKRYSKPPKTHIKKKGTRNRYSK